MTGTFIVSLDCEGKWGMADGLRPYHQKLTDSALARAYETLVSIFARHEIAATFGYVMAFTLTPEERETLRASLEPEGGKADAWMRHFWDAQARGDVEGWFQPRALEIVREDGRHEIASHGFCHRPLGDSSISEAGARAELRAADAAARIKGLCPRTFIFPRNEVGHLGVLREAGFLGYRELLTRPGGKLGQAIRLAEEFNVRPRPQRSKPPRPDGLVPIPPGYFFNWRFGARARVPVAATLARWKHLIDRASEGDVVHLWLHPHNLITAPDTGRPLEAVLEHAARRRDEGRLRILTQQRYCEAINQQPL
jgi:peptidoglycan/xylan/chitin deacetylase (PgdA/CDA1 family)